MFIDSFVFRRVMPKYFFVFAYVIVIVPMYFKHVSSHFCNEKIYFRLKKIHKILLLITNEAKPMISLKRIF